MLKVKRMTTNAVAQSFVFLDIETTGLPFHELDGRKTKVTEICLVSISRNDLMKTDGKLPRNLQKLILLCNPGKIIPKHVEDITGLDNFLLEKEYPFNEKKAAAIKYFLEQCIPPICLVAHNGLRFDFPLLQEELKNFTELQIIPEDTRCADTLQAFRYLSRCSESECVLSPYLTESDLEIFQVTEEVEKEINRNSGDILRTMALLRAINETTPKSQIIRPRMIHSAVPKRRLFDDATGVRGNSEEIEQPFTPLRSFKLKNVYKNIFGEDAKSLHQAEDDVLMMIKCCLKFGQPILDWLDKNSIEFKEVKPFYDRYM